MVYCGRLNRQVLILTINNHNMPLYHGLSLIIWLRTRGNITQCVYVEPTLYFCVLTERD